MKVTIRKGGRITIPQAVRKRLAISEGMQLEIVVRENTIELQNLPSKVEHVLKESGSVLKSKTHSLVDALIKMQQRAAMQEEE